MPEALISKAAAVLFDFDGVVADSEPFFFESYRRAFAGRGHRLDEEEYWEYWTCRGEGIPGEIRRHGLPLGEKEVAEIFAERREAYSGFCREGAVPLYPGMMEAVVALVRAGKPCAIASNSFEDDIRVILDRAGFPDPPCAVVGRRKGLRTKPAPDIFVYTAGLLGVQPADCLVVEDALKGLQAAREVGMACVIVKTRYNEGVDFSKAAAVVPGHAAFVEAVGSWAARGRRGPAGR